MLLCVVARVLRRQLRLGSTVVTEPTTAGDIECDNAGVGGRGRSKLGQLDVEVIVHRESQWSAYHAAGEKGSWHAFGAT